MGVIVCVQGETGTGKTSFALTFPKHITYMELDLGGFRRAKRRFKSEIEQGLIIYQAYELPLQAIEDRLGFAQASRLTGVKELWYKIMTDYMKAIRDDKVNTVVIDSFTFLWEICHSGFLQEKQEKSPTREQLSELEYGEPNMRIRTMIYQAKRADKNLILTAPLSSVYQKKLINNKLESVETGAKRAAGWSHIPKEVDYIIQTSSDTKRSKDGAVSTILNAEIVKSAAGIELVGLQFDWPSWDKLENMIKLLEEE